PQVEEIRRHLAAADWVDGAATAGPMAAGNKRNLQLPGDSPLAQQLAEVVAGALSRHPLFMSAVLPKHILPPRFNRYEGGGHYGNHVDNAIQADTVRRSNVRTDVSTTLFLSDPQEYEGGELIIEDGYSQRMVKLAAGDAIVYPATSLHRVEPVTSGTRFASFLWTQSMVRDAWQRNMLFDLDMTIVKIRQKHGNTPEALALTNHYHNLLRQWAEL
ncbi:MAG TPA: Fe2+-dependent dioxygenase, partial [Moraxellaceae bacterium]